jgi:hypothetical protein
VAVEASKENQPVHVVPRKDGWAVVREGNKKASAVHPTRHQAEEHGRSLARKSGTDFLLHDRDGRVLVHDFYGPPHEGERVHAEPEGQVTVTRTDTGVVQRQVAYHDRERDAWTVEVHTYPTPDESNPELREDPMGRMPRESVIYEELSSDELQKRYPELWEKVKR